MRNKIEYVFEQLKKGQKIQTFAPHVPRAPLDKAYLKLAFNGITCDRGRCSKCGICISGCPFNAITRDVEDFPQFDASRCYGCTRCAARCPRGAVAVGGYAHTAFYTLNTTALTAVSHPFSLSLSLSLSFFVFLSLGIITVLIVCIIL